MNRIDRLIAILTTLQSRRFSSVEFISEKYGISIRTVYRDIKALGEIGVPITYETGKGYYILQGYFLPPVSFTTEEAQALILISALSDKYADKTVRNNINTALDKIKSILKSSDRENAERLSTGIRVHHSSSVNYEHDYLTPIQNAIISKKILLIEYVNNREIESKREIEPIGLTFYSDQWHAIAWCRKRKAYRDFKVARIKYLSETGSNFENNSHIDLSEYILSLK